MNKLRYFISYLIRSFHLHGIHSPFVFNLTKNIIREKAKFYAYDEIEAIRAKLLLTEKKVTVLDLGQGPSASYTSSINSICKKSSQKKKFAQLIYRLAREQKAETILELGTSLGITTSYLAKACPSAMIISIEGSSELSKIAEINLKKLNILNVKLEIGDFDEHLSDSLESLKKVDIVYFDGNHEYEATMRYFEKCLPYSHEKSLFIFDDIYWSAGMKKAWKEIIAHDQVSCSVDLFKLGLVYFDPTITQQNFTVYHSANLDPS